MWTADGVLLITRILKCPCGRHNQLRTSLSLWNPLTLHLEVLPENLSLWLYAWAYYCVVTYNACVFILFSLLSLSLFFPAFLLLCRLGGSLSRVLDEDFYKQPFSELIGYVYVAPTNILLFILFAYVFSIVTTSKHLTFHIIFISSVFSALVFYI